MTQEYNAFGSSWYTSWGTSWGKTPVADALERSGVTRLWMYELYSKSIEEDQKKQEVIEEPARLPVMRYKAVKSTKKARQSRPKVKPQHKGTPKPLPAIVRATPQGPSYIDFVEKLINDLPVLDLTVKIKAKAEKIKQEKVVKEVKRKQHEEEWLLLMAA